MDVPDTVPNPDLHAPDGQKPWWAIADNRRQGWHNLHRLVRYSSSFRADRVMKLEKCIDLRIAGLPSVRHLTTLPPFSAMVVVQGNQILHEQYAQDFGPSHPHSIQSISKTLIHLIIGKLVDSGHIDLNRQISDYVPEIGTGYRDVTVQQVLNMDLVNDYSMDMADSAVLYYKHEEALGWRLPADGKPERGEIDFLKTIESRDTRNLSGSTHYKDTNTTLLAWLAERVGGQPLRSSIADIVDAAGIEGVLDISTDRWGFPSFAGGVCITARDLARYMSLFVRKGDGVNGRSVGDADFLSASLDAGVPMPAPYDRITYSNQLMVLERSVGHLGWAGQCAIANLDTGRVGVFFSVLENAHAAAEDYPVAVFDMLQEATSIPAA